MQTADAPGDGRSRGLRQSVEDRIEQARGRLALGFSHRELARELADEWGLARRTVRRYLDRAAGRNRELVAKAPTDALADAVAFWRGLLLDAMEDRDAARADLPAATGRDAARLAKRAADAERRAATYRGRLDRLLGLLSPTAAADRLTVATAGPLASRAAEPADPDRAVRDLLEAAGVVAVPEPRAASG